MQTFSLPLLKLQVRDIFKPALPDRTKQWFRAPYRTPQPFFHCFLFVAVTLASSSYLQSLTKPGDSRASRIWGTFLTFAFSIDRLDVGKYDRDYLGLYFYTTLWLPPRHTSATCSRLGNIARQKNLRGTLMGRILRVNCYVKAYCANICVCLYLLHLKNT